VGPREGQEPAHRGQREGQVQDGCGRVRVRPDTPKRLAECTYAGSGTLRIKGTDTVDGQKVVVLQDAGDKPGAIPGGVVDKRCQTDQDPGEGEVTFSEFDAVPEIAVPKGALDLQDLASQNDGSIA
jgi:hypothetical protein